MKHAAALAICLLLVACRSNTTPTSPDTAVQPPGSTVTTFGGLWQGEFALTACRYQTCAGDIGRLIPFIIRLEQEAAAVHGIFESEGAVIDVRGNIDPDGTLSIAGYAPAAGNFDRVGDANLHRLAARIDAAAGLTGRVEFDLRPTFAYAQVVQYRGEISSARRIAMAPSTSFTGRWDGSFVVRNCDRCLAPVQNQSGVVDLQLQGSQDVIGQITLPEGFVIPVRGSVSGGILTFDVPATASNNSDVSLLSWTSERDGFGRMFGRFSYSRRAMLLTREFYTARWEAELMTVTLRP